MSLHKLVSRLISQSKKATPRQLAQLVQQAGAAPFAGDLLEVDEPLWGGFWQGDVIAPGYRLPAVELALLRAMRLDSTWPEGTSVVQFLADLHQAISDPQAGVWALTVAGEPGVVFASVTGEGSGVRGQGLGVSDQPLTTVAWYCAATGQLHAGYRTTIDQLNFRGAVEQRRLDLKGAAPPEAVNQSNWLEQVLDQYNPISGQSPAVGGPHLAAQLDAEILRLRAQMRK